jgi:hypothetical protein
MVCPREDSSKRFSRHPTRLGKKQPKVRSQAPAFGYFGHMSMTPRTATEDPSSNGHAPDDDALGHIEGPSAWEGTYTDDIWPLEVWLSREDSFVDGDTWHAGRGRRWFSLR